MLEGTWSIAISEAEDTTKEAEADTDSHDEVAIRQPQAAASLTYGAMAAVLNKIKTLTALVQNQENNIDHFKKGWIEAER